MFFQRFFPLFLLILLVQPLKAQITANPTSGCVPLSVTFGSPAGSSNHAWDFKDTKSSNLDAPTNTFTNPGVYNVTYTGTVGGSTVNYTIAITVYEKPNVDFTTTTDSMGCKPLSVKFKDLSTGIGGAKITEWAWTFGDGGSATTATPTYLYQTAQGFNVSLQVKDERGCSSSLTKNNFIKTSDKPVPIVTPPGASSCITPFNITFFGSSSQSKSSFGSTLTYKWSFGNGNTSTLADPPQQTYPAIGNYQVKLKVTDANRCVDSVQRMVSVAASAKASFLVKNAINDSTCTDVVVVNNSTPTGVYYNFKYGDLSAGTFSLAHSYALPGNYIIQLIAGSGLCQDTISVPIHAVQFKSKFTSNPTFSCAAPYSIQFSDSSTNAEKWKWKFGNGDSSNVKNPTVLIKKPVINPYTRTNKFIFVNKLTATSRYGCSLNSIGSDTLNLPVARFVPSKVDGCIPLSIDFADSSKSKDPILSWEWNFGDGGTSTAQNPSHTYNTVGEYDAKLIIHTKLGCPDTSVLIHIRAGKNATGTTFTTDKTVVCPNENVTLTGVPFLADSIDMWHYSADGLRFSTACPQDPNATGHFETKTGAQDITLHVVSNGCETEIVKPALITVNGPIGRYTYTSDCSSPLNYTFTSITDNATSFTWDFGDGTPVNTTNATVTHTFPTKNNKVVTLTTNNSSSGCQFQYKQTIKVRTLKADFTISSKGCKSEDVKFDASDSIDVFHSCDNNTKGFIFFFGDKTAPYRGDDAKPVHKYDTSGTFKVLLKVQDENGCIDTMSKKVKLFNISALAKERINLKSCFPLNIDFQDSSIHDNPISKYEWTFGDGKDTTAKNPGKHLYTAGGPFNAVLKITDSQGCTDSNSYVISASSIDKSFSVSKSSLCSYDSVNFTANAVGVSYNWKFGDGSTSTQKSKYHNYLNGGTFKVLLKVNDGKGCIDSLSKSVNVEKAQAGLVSSADSKPPCGDQIQITFQDTNKQNTVWDWELDLGHPIISNRTVTETYIPGKYKIRLITSTPLNCKDTAYREFTMHNPKAKVNLTDSTICKGGIITFNIKDTSNIYTFHWDFGDGTEDVAKDTVSHKYNYHPGGGKTRVDLIYYSQDSTCPTVASKIIYIEQVIADFKRNNGTSLIDSVHCLGITDNIIDMSTNADSWQWNFGDGSTYNGKSPSTHQYSNAGLFTIILNIKDNETQCVDTIKKTIKINPLPVAFASGGDTCYGKPIQMISTGGNYYKWGPSSGLSADSIANPLAQPESTTTYTVTVTDLNGCTSSATADAIVYPKPPQFNLDTAIVIGEHINLNVGPNHNFVYIWSPSDSLTCDNCMDPVARPHSDIQYGLVIHDNVGCFVTNSTFRIKVLPLTSVDLPSAFSPNGDGTNDFIFVRGWGIRRLIDFKIYNRWGEMVFQTNDINEGWNGYFNGVIQNSDTYIYTVSVETWVENNKTLTKKGSFELLR